MLINPMQLQRINKSREDFLKFSYVIDDNLEMGSLRAYDQCDEGVIVQEISTFSITTPMVGEVIVNDRFVEDKDCLWVHKAHVELGHEELLEKMLLHVMKYALFYGYKNMEMNETLFKELNKKIPNTMSMFVKKGNTYVVELEGKSEQEQG